LAAIFGGLSPHPKIPFPAAGFGHKIRPHLQPQFRVLRRGNLGIFGRRGNYSGLSVIELRHPTFAPNVSGSFTDDIPAAIAAHSAAAAA